VTGRRWNKVLDSTLRKTGPEGTRQTRKSDTATDLDAARRMALDGLVRAFETAERGENWFAMKAALGRIEDAVQAVWYASRVRDGARR